MTTISDNFETFSKIQKEGLEPLREFTGVVVDGFEKFARKNYALYGDVLDYTVSQARLTAEASDPKELFEAQVERNKAFGELLAERINEYVELGKDVQQEASAKVAKAAKAPKAARTVKKAA